MSGLIFMMLILFGVVVYVVLCVFELQYLNGESYWILFELMCVYLLLVEVCGYGFGQEMLQIGKCEVMIIVFEGVGNYVLQLMFFDGYLIGIYLWDLLYELVMQQDVLWCDYFDKLKVVGVECDVLMQVVGVLYGYCY